MKQISLQLAITTTLLIFTTITTTTTAFLRPLVRDVNGEPLSSDKTYYLLPTSANSPSSGGFTYSRFAEPNIKCPEYFFMTQVPDSLSLGSPISLHPPRIDIRLGTELLIQTRDFPGLHEGCDKFYTSIWAMAPYKSSHVVILELMFPRPRFRIVSDNQGNYNMRVCYGQDLSFCGLLGLVEDVYGKVALGVNVTAKPLSFVFQPSSYPDNNKSFLQHA